MACTSVIGRSFALCPVRNRPPWPALGFQVSSQGRPMVHRRFILAGGLAVLSTGLARAQTRPQTPAPEQALAPAGKRPSFRLEEAARFDHQATGVAVSADGRVFVNFPRWTEDSPISVAKVAQVIHFGEDVALQGSYLNDVRFHPNGATAFITDSGARGAIVVVDLPSGNAHARLDGHPSTQPEKGVEVTVKGEKIKRPDGRPFQVAADGIALSMDGSTLYWQALTGRTLYRVDTAALMSDNPEDAARK